MIDLDTAQHADHVADNIRTVGCRRCAPYIVSETGWEEHRQRVMGQTHECGCATFGPGPHPVDARHPNVRSCEHAEGYDEPTVFCTVCGWTAAMGAVAHATVIHPGSVVVPQMDREFIVWPALGAAQEKGT